MDEVKSVFELDKSGDSIDKSAMDKALAEYILSEKVESLLKRKSMAHLHEVLSEPRELDDDDLCVRDGYRDIVSMMHEVKLAGRTLAAARADQYDPKGSDDVDPSTRPDYNYMDAVDDARRVSDRLKAQADSSPAPETPAPETPAPETPAPETPAPETPSSPAQ